MPLQAKLMILLCPAEKSTQFHYPLDPKKIRAEGFMHKDTTYQGSDRQDFYGKKKKKKKTRLDLVKHLMIKKSERNFTQRFDDSMSSFSSEKKRKFDNLIYTVRGDKT